MKNREILQLLPSQFQYDGGLLREYVESIQSPILHPVVEVFETNIKNLAAVVTMPVYFALSASQRRRAVDRYLDEGHTLDGDTARKMIHVYMDELQDNNRDSNVQAANAHLIDIMEIDGLRSAIRLLFTSAITMCWTAFEAVASDGWDVTFTAQSTRIVNHGLDLSAVLASTAKRKFDFTRLEGIKSAYKIFNVKNELNKVWESQGLKRLHLDRNLIVHQAGIVDKVYQEEMRKLTKTTFPLGKPIHIDAKIISHLVNQAIIGGGELLRFLDRWLKTHLPSN
jgi:hypothetical protein